MDTNPSVEEQIIEHWRVTPSWQKLAYINELNASLQIIAISDLQRRYPNDSPKQLRRRLAARWLGSALAEHVYGPIDDQNNATD